MKGAISSLFAMDIWSETRVLRVQFEVILGQIWLFERVFLGGFEVLGGVKFGVQTC